MIRYTLFISLLLQSLSFQSASCQNVYDLQHSRTFASYLMQTQQYKLALTEWQRVLFMEPKDTSAQLSCLKAFRLSGLPENGLKKIDEWYPKPPILLNIKREGIKLSLTSGNFIQYEHLLGVAQKLPADETNYYKLGAALIRWEGKHDPLPETKPSNFGGYHELSTIRDQAMRMKWKSPGLSMALSALIPGLGKVYTGDWKDGIVSFLFFATNAWQTYRGFSQKGWNHPYGYIFGTLSIGFYGANLFGSWKSARDHNLRQTDQIRHEAYDLLNSRF